MELQNNSFNDQTKPLTRNNIFIKLSNSNYLQRGHLNTTTNLPKSFIKISIADMDISGNQIQCCFTEAR